MDTRGNSGHSNAGGGLTLELSAINNSNNKGSTSSLNSKELRQQNEDVTLYFKKISSALFYGMASFMITVVNKTVLTSYKFPSFLFLSLGQLAASIVVLEKSCTSRNRTSKHCWQQVWCCCTGEQRGRERVGIERNNNNKYDFGAIKKHFGSKNTPRIVNKAGKLCANMEIKGQHIP